MTTARQDQKPAPGRGSPWRRLLHWLRRRWLLLLVLAGFGLLVALRFDDIVALTRTLIGGRVEWVLTAVLLQVAYYSLYAFLYQLAFATVEVEGRASHLLPVLFASLFLKVVVPSGGLSAVAVFVDDAARREQSAARAAEGALLVLVADLVTMVPFILYGFAFLQAQGVLELYQVLVALLFLLFTAALAGLLLLGRLQPERLRVVLRSFQRWVNGLAARLHRPPPLGEDWAERNAAECIGAACNIAAHPRPLRYTLAVALLVHAVSVASLYAVTLAYREPLDPGAVVAALSMDVIFSVINIIPHGIGIVEGIMALVFISLAVPATTAVVIALAFRGLSLWLPLAIGFFLLHRVQTFGAGRRP